MAHGYKDAVRINGSYAPNATDRAAQKSRIKDAIDKIRSSQGGSLAATADLLDAVVKSLKQAQIEVTAEAVDKHLQDGAAKHG